MQASFNESLQASSTVFVQVSAKLFLQPSENVSRKLYQNVSLQASSGFHQASCSAHSTYPDSIFFTIPNYKHSHSRNPPPPQVLNTLPVPPTVPVAHAVVLLDASLENALLPDIYVAATAITIQTPVQEALAAQMPAVVLPTGNVATTSEAILAPPSAPILPDIFRETAKQAGQQAVAAAASVNVASQLTHSPSLIGTRPSHTASTSSDVASSFAGVTVVNGSQGLVLRDPALPSPQELAFLPMPDSILPEGDTESIFSRMLASQALRRASAHNPALPAVILGEPLRSAAGEAAVAADPVVREQPRQASTDPTAMVPDTKTPTSFPDVGENADAEVEVLGAAAAAETAVDALPARDADLALSHAPRESPGAVEMAITHPDASLQDGTTAATHMVNAAGGEVSHLMQSCCERNHMLLSQFVC